MRFLIGSKVEVWCKNEVPSGSWRCAEIVNSNRYYVTVRYDTRAVDVKIIEKVPRNIVRPCPPSVERLENWIPGDIIEILHNFLWKMATVLKVFMKNRYLVRLIGLSDECVVHIVDTRVRQSCLDGKWVHVGQGSGNHEDRKCNELSCKNHYQLPSYQTKKVKRKLDSHEDNDYAKRYNRNNFQDTCIVPPLGSSYFDSYNQVAALDPSLDTRKLLGQYKMHSFLNNTMSHLPGKNIKKIRMLSENINRCPSRLEHNDSDVSSVGSCSITHPRLSGFPFDDDYSSSYAESFSNKPNEDGNRLKSFKELVDKIHRIELHTYRCTMKALRASRYISWEQESLITNLRLSLGISNDEHLMELRNVNGRKMER